MKTLLLTRRSPYQFYCANTLHMNGVLDDVILEDGGAYPAAPMTLRRAAKRLSRAVKEFPAHPVRTLRQVSAKLHARLYYGDRNKHEKRIFGDNYESLHPGIRAHPFKNVNDSAAAERLRALNPDLVFVFGTRIVKPHVFQESSAVFVNMHWGWSPDYRGEGIVSALSKEGPNALGVTVHLLDPGIDSGDILYRRRPDIDSDDNFYSIGLKLAKLGTELFLEAHRKRARDGVLIGEPQDLAAGALYTSKHLRERPELYAKAWNVLKAKP